MVEFKQRLVTALLAGLVLVGAACAPGLRVTRLQPSRFNLGATRRVAVLNVTGHPAAAPATLAELQREIIDSRYYTLIDAMNRGLSIVVTAGGTRIDVGQVRQQVEADVYLVANVTRFDVVETERTETRSENGRNREVLRRKPEAHVRINFQVVKSDGQVLVFRDYDGSSTGTAYDAHLRPNYDPGALLNRAIHESVARFNDDITPRQVIEKIELDDSNQALKPGIELAESGDLPGAEHSWLEVLRQEPDNAGAIYNIGVLLETRGEFDAAAASYQKAHQISQKLLYRDAIEDLNQRLQDAQSLQQNL